MSVDTQRRECPAICSEHVVLEVPNHAMSHLTLKQITIRCPDHGYVMRVSESP